MDRNSDAPSASDPIDPLAVTPVQEAPAPPKKTLTGFAKVWVIFWVIGNLAATCAPASRLTDSSLGGLAAMIMLLSAVVTAGYILLYNKKSVGLFMILGGNILGIFMNFIEISGYVVNVSTGLIIGIITYFITRKQVDYPFWQPRAKS